MTTTFVSTGTQISIGQTIAASIGLDEFAGPYDEDVYTFDVTAGQKLAFDVDSVGPGTLNTYIRVFPMFGSLIISSPLASR